MKRCALVTGGSAGMGLASAHALAEAGNDIILIARSVERLTSARAQILSAHPGISVDTVSCDLSVAADVAAVAEQLKGEKAPDIVVYVAGGPRLYAPGKEDESEFRRHLQSHSLSLVTLMQAFAPTMQERGFGRFIAVMSRAVGEPRPDNPLSAAVRLPAWAIMKSYSRSSSFSRVTFNALLPGLFDTERFREVCAELSSQTGEPIDKVRERFMEGVPAGRLGQPKELGALVALLASDNGAYVTGQRIVIDGGSSSGL